MVWVGFDSRSIGRSDEIIKIATWIEFSCKFDNDIAQYCSFFANAIRLMDLSAVIIIIIIIITIDTFQQNYPINTRRTATRDKIWKKNQKSFEFRHLHGLDRFSGPIYIFISTALFSFKYKSRFCLHTT